MWTPGRSYRGPLPPLTAEEAAVVPRLERHVQRLAGEIGMEPTESVPLFNGKIPCRLLRYEG